MAEHLVPNKRKYPQSYPVKTPLELEEFAGQVEQLLEKARGPASAARIVCRLMTHKDPRISALMTIKWVEWRYGKAKDSAGEASRNFAIQIINHIPRPGDASAPDTSVTVLGEAEPGSSAAGQDRSETKEKD